jgi:hypothetical protein
MPDVAKGIPAKCADKFDVWHEVKIGSYGGMNDGLRALLDGEAAAGETSRPSSP